jgi:hypothetical protein
VTEGDKVNIKFKVSSDETQLPEKEIHMLFEKHLGQLEEGLTFIDREVKIGTGDIDTLALDESGRPVFIEYKIDEKFASDGLIQLMDYLSWFIKIESNFLALREYITKRKSDIEGKTISNDIRLILVISNVDDDRLKNACYSIRNQVQIYTYQVLKEKEDITIIPQLILDNSKIERTIEDTTTEENLIKEHKKLEALYNDVKVFVSSLGDDFLLYAKGGEIRVKRRKQFLIIRFRKRWLMLDMDAGREITDDRFKPWKDSDWGYVNISNTKEFDQHVKDWVKRAYERAE